MAIAKAITYENLPEEHKKDPKIIPFEYKRPFLQEIEEYLRDKEGDQTSIGIVGQLAKSNQDEERRLMGGYECPLMYSRICSTMLWRSINDINLFVQSKNSN